ncbi:uncharacterized protein LOC120713398 [Panicum virgatum]|uniref:uncharacterized protein LOC120713398 n=1 Tax=Panicum virgatum TaxID=38727 RepID=UPI0019D5758A|nr:uncharacterized protein LOC120713398 [Panicum virgatum]
MTGPAQEELKEIVEKKLSAHGYTNMKGGLETGLQVLDGRQHKSSRISSIVLMSDGKEYPTSGARDVDVSGVAVYTFGFGEDHDEKLLGAIANNSHGGTFLYVKDEESLTGRFAEILGGLLGVVVQNLKLTVWQQQGHSTIEKVDAGSYPQNVDENVHSVTVSFGDLFSGEFRKVIIHLLPAVDREYRATAIIAAQCSYRYKSQLDIRLSI